MPLIFTDWVSLTPKSVEVDIEGAAVVGAAALAGHHDLNIVNLGCPGIVLELEPEGRLLVNRDGVGIQAGVLEGRRRVSGGGDSDHGAKCDREDHSDARQPGSSLGSHVHHLPQEIRPRNYALS